MLRVTIEIVPHGQEEFRRVLGKLIVGLDKIDPKNRGDYSVRLELPEEEGGHTLRGTVVKHERSLGWLPLVLRSLIILSPAWDGLSLTRLHPGKRSG